MTSPDLSAAMHGAILLSYAGGLLTKVGPQIAALSGGVLINCDWSAVESCAWQQLMILTVNKSDADGRPTAQLTPAGFDLAEQLIGAARARRIRNGTRPETSTTS